MIPGDAFHQLHLEVDLPDGDFWGFGGYAVVRDGCIVHAEITRYDTQATWKEPRSMLKSLVVVLLVVAGLCTGTASACRGNRQVPEHGHAAGHDVLAVEVTGIHLTAHEAYRAATLGLQPWPVAPDGEDVLFPVGSTPTFTVDVLVHDSTGPGGAAIRTLTLGGCGVRVPALEERGLAFIASDGTVGIVWQDRDAELARWLDELGLAFRADP